MGFGKIENIKLKQLIDKLKNNLEISNKFNYELINEKKFNLKDYSYIDTLNLEAEKYSKIILENKIKIDNLNKQLEKNKISFNNFNLELKNKNNTINEKINIIDNKNKIINSFEEKLKNKEQIIENKMKEILQIKNYNKNLEIVEDKLDKKINIIKDLENELVNKSEIIQEKINEIENLNKNTLIIENWNKKFKEIEEKLIEKDNKIKELELILLETNKNNNNFNNHSKKFQYNSSLNEEDLFNEEKSSNKINGKFEYIVDSKIENIKTVLKSSTLENDRIKNIYNDYEDSYKESLIENEISLKINPIGYNKNINNALINNKNPDNVTKNEKINLNEVLKNFNFESRPKKNDNIDFDEDKENLLENKIKDKNTNYINFSESFYNKTNLVELKKDKILNNFNKNKFSPFKLKPNNKNEYLNKTKNRSYKKNDELKAKSYTPPHKQTNCFTNKYIQNKFKNKFKNRTNNLSNKRLIINSINDVILAGMININKREKIINIINESNKENFIIIFKQIGRHDLKSIYYIKNKNEIEKLYCNSNLPNIIKNNMVEFYYKYNSNNKKFIKIENNNCFSLNINAIVLKQKYFFI